MAPDFFAGELDKILTFLSSKLHRKKILYFYDGKHKMMDQRRAERSTDKRNKFVELAERRTKNAIRAIRVISKLGNRSAYEYEDADVRKIANALTKEIEALKARMSSSGGKETVEFKL